MTAIGGKSCLYIVAGRELEQIQYLIVSVLTGIHRTHGHATEVETICGDDRRSQLAAARGSVLFHRGLLRETVESTSPLPSFSEFLPEKSGEIIVAAGRAVPDGPGHAKAIRASHWPPLRFVC